MKLVTEFFDLSEAEKTSSRMRSAGVFTVVTSKRSYNLSRVKTGALRVGLWVVFEDQYHDAMQMLDNYNHKPKRVISAVEMNEIQDLAGAEISNSMKKLLQKSAAWLFGGILLALLIYVAIGIINDA
jgi:hypothetical protein